MEVMCRAGSRGCGPSRRRRTRRRRRRRRRRGRPSRRRTGVVALLLVGTSAHEPFGGRRPVKEAAAAT